MILRARHEALTVRDKAALIAALRMRGGSSRWTWRVVLLVLGTTPRTVDSDLIDGVVRKWAGTVLNVDVEALRQEVAASHD